MDVIELEVHLYGDLAADVKDHPPGYAEIKVVLPKESSVGDLLLQIGIPMQNRGITFINGNLSALPGLQPDIGRKLENGDRVAFFDLKSMWPFQYRQGASLTEELEREMSAGDACEPHHSYEKPEI